jgi:hypothetical protein
MLIDPAYTDLSQLLRRERAIAIRYSTPLSALVGKVSYHVVSIDKNYGLGLLPKKARHDVQHGIAHATIEPIALSRLAEEGWTLRAQTLIRQGRDRAEHEKWWRRLCQGAEGLAGFEAWGALHDGKLVAALLALTTDECCSILYQQSLTDHMKYSVNNALTYAFTHEVIRRPHIRQVFYGLQSLDAPTTIDEFKFRMGYTAKPVRQRVVFHPMLAPIFNKASHALVLQLRRWQPANSMLAKTEGMLRFYIQGKQPLEQQSWPDCLLTERSALLLA